MIEDIQLNHHRSCARVPHQLGISRKHAPMALATQTLATATERRHLRQRDEADAVVGSIGAQIDSHHGCACSLILGACGENKLARKFG